MMIMSTDIAEDFRNIISKLPVEVLLMMLDGFKKDKNSDKAIRMAIRDMEKEVKRRKAA